MNASKSVKVVTQEKEQTAMAQAHDNTKADPKEVENAHAMWVGFALLTKRTIIAVVATLVLMAIFLL